MDEDGEQRQETEKPEGTPEREPEKAEGAPERGPEKAEGAAEGEPANIEGAPVAADEPAATGGPDGRRGSRRRGLAVAALVALVGAGLFLAGFGTHALVDDDVDTSGIEERLAALEQRIGDGGAAGGGSQPSPEAAVSAASEDDPSWGSEDAPVVVVEFSDFQCPYCARFAVQTHEQIQETYGDDVRFIYRDYPISGIHQYAQKAAEAGQCAHEQGLFWEYHDLLFDNQAALSLNDLKGYAEQVGADTEAFNECLDSGEKREEVLQDLQDGQTAGIEGTPGFVINGAIVRGAQPFEVFQQAIDEALAAAD